MAIVDIDLETPVAAGTVRSALLDFSSRRPDVWPGVLPAVYEVYAIGETSAEVKEGSKAPGGIAWARERYDWSDSETVRWTVVESNFCAPGGTVSATITPGQEGGSKIHIEWDRKGTNFKGRFITFMVRLTNGRPVAASFKKGLATLEHAVAEPTPV